MTDEAALWIEGKPYTQADLTFREQHALRRYIWELAPNGDQDEASEIDVIPAFICVVMQRTNPDFTLDRALDAKPADLAAPEKKSPPTRRAKK